MKALTWLGGGQWDELNERHERSTHALAGVVVLLNAALAWLIATFAIAHSSRWPAPAILSLTLAFGLLIGAITRALASGPVRGWRAGAARVAVATAVGVVVGELAALVVFSGPIDRRLDEQAAAKGDSSPAVAQATAELQRSRDARTALDQAVDAATRHRDAALVVARCEYHPTPACPQTHITGVPGTGPETRAADDYLAEAQRELDNAIALRDDRAAGLDAQISSQTSQLTDARRAANTDADHGLGARWICMNDLTSTSVSMVLLRLVGVGFFTLLSLLPLIIRRWRGETTEDRHAAARAQRDRAEMDADTAIAVKRAEGRAAAEIMWAEHQLAQARLAIETQAARDRAEHHRQVTQALEVEAEHPPAAELTAAEEPAHQTPNLPVPVQDRPVIPKIPDVTRAAARWIRPLVPTFVTRAIDTTTQPVRAVRHVFEEVEEITFTLKRTHKVSVDSTESGSQRPEAASPPPSPRRVKADVDRRPLPESDDTRQLSGPTATPHLPAKQ